MEELETLKKITKKYIFDDEENHLLIKQYEEQLHKITLKERLQERPGFKEWIKYLSLQIETSENILKTNRTLTDLQRHEQFVYIDVAKNFLSFFDTEGARESLKKAINEDLERTRDA